MVTISYLACPCGAPVTSKRQRKQPVPRCPDCAEALMVATAREMHAKAGPAWDAWLAGRGDEGWAHARQSPRTDEARRRNLLRANAARAAKRAAAAGQDAGVSQVSPPPVPPPSAVRSAPPALFVAPS